MRISDWSSDVCSSDLQRPPDDQRLRGETRAVIPPAERLAADGDAGKCVVEVRGPDAQRIEREAPAGALARRGDHQADRAGNLGDAGRGDDQFGPRNPRRGDREERRGRSEEHTSELPSLMRSSYAVFCLT